MENLQDRGVWIRIRIRFVLRGWIRIRIRSISDRIRNPDLTTILLSLFHFPRIDFLSLFSSLIISCQIAFSMLISLLLFPWRDSNWKVQMTFCDASLGNFEEREEVGNRGRYLRTLAEKLGIWKGVNTREYLNRMCRPQEFINVGIFVRKKLLGNLWKWH